MHKTVEQKTPTPLEGVGASKNQRSQDQEDQAQKEKIEKLKNARISTADVMKAKKMAKELEKGNTTMLVTFRSRGDWWKLGGNSALIYFYKIAPEIGKTPKLHRDSDFFSKFNGDVISIKNIDKLAKDLERLGIVYREETRDDRLVRVFDLVEECTELELRKIRANEKRKIAALNELVEPKLLIPRVGVVLKEMTVMMYRLKLPPNNPRAVTLVDSLVAEGMEIVADYVTGCKNNRGKIEDLESAARRVSRLMTKIEMMKELEIWDLDKCILMCDRLDEAQRLLNKRIKAMKKEKEKDDKEADDEKKKSAKAKDRAREARRRESVRRVVIEAARKSEQGSAEGQEKDGG